MQNAPSPSESVMRPQIRRVNFGPYANVRSLQPVIYVLSLSHSRQKFASRPYVVIDRWKISRCPYACRRRDTTLVRNAPPPFVNKSQFSRVCEGDYLVFRSPVKIVYTSLARISIVIVTQYYTRLSSPRPWCPCYCFRRKSASRVSRSAVFMRGDRHKHIILIIILRVFGAAAHSLFNYSLYGSNNNNISVNAGPPIRQTHVFFFFSNPIVKRYTWRESFITSGRVIYSSTLLCYYMHFRGGPVSNAHGRAACTSGPNRSLWISHTRTSGTLVRDTSS